MTITQNQIDIVDRAIARGQRREEAKAQRELHHRFVALLAHAYNTNHTMQEIDAAYVTARAELVKFLKAQS